MAPDHHDSLESLLVTTQARPVKQRLVFQDIEGRPVPAHVSANVINQPDELSICIVAADLTELENSTTMLQRLRCQQQALHESEDLARQRLAEIEAIYKSAAVVLCVFDRDLRYLRINDRLAEINGLPVEQHIGRTVREIVPDLAPTAEDLARRIFESGRPVLNVEFSGTTTSLPGVRRTWVEHWLPLRALLDRRSGSASRSKR